MDCMIFVVNKGGLYLSVNFSDNYTLASLFDFIILNFVHSKYKLRNLDISVFKFKDPYFQEKLKTI